MILSKLRSKLQLKMIATVFLIVVIVLAVSGTMVLRLVASNSQQQAIDYMEALSREYATSAEKMVNQQLAEATALTGHWHLSSNYPLNFAASQPWNFSRHS